MLFTSQSVFYVLPYIPCVILISLFILTFVFYGNNGNRNNKYVFGDNSFVFFSFLRLNVTYKVIQGRMLKKFIKSFKHSLHYVIEKCKDLRLLWKEITMEFQQRASG